MPFGAEVYLYCTLTRMPQRPELHLRRFGAAEPGLRETRGAGTSGGDRSRASEIQRPPGALISNGLQAPKRFFGMFSRACRVFDGGADPGVKLIETAIGMRPRILKAALIERTQGTLDLV